jgi:hypothetical protein
MNAGNHDDTMDTKKESIKDSWGETVMVPAGAPGLRVFLPQRYVDHPTTECHFNHDDHDGHDERIHQRFLG